MTQRVYLGSDRVTVSKPGYDAVSPPAVDSRYLAFDSRLPTGRPLEIGQIPNFAFRYAATIPFTTTYPANPAVEIVAWVSNFDSGLGRSYSGYTYSMAMRDANSSVAYNRTSFYLGIFPDRFQILDDAQFVRTLMMSNSYNFYYVVWQNW